MGLSKDFDDPHGAKGLPDFLSMKRSSAISQWRKKKESKRKKKERRLYPDVRKCETGKGWGIGVVIRVG